MKLDEIQDIEILRSALKSLMCKCTKEIELKNDDDKIIKTVIGEWYYYDFNDEFGEYWVCDGNGYNTVMLDFEWKEKDLKNFDDYFELEEGE